MGKDLMVNKGKIKDVGKGKVVVSEEKGGKGKGKVGKDEFGICIYVKGIGVGCLFGIFDLFCYI